MGPITANAPQFLLNTDYPMDKVVYLSSGSFTMAAGSLSSYTINHGLPFTPLVNGYWSLTPDFSVKYEFSSGTFSPNQSNYTFYSKILTLSTSILESLGAGADATSIRIGYNNADGASAVAYYRLYGFEPLGSATDAPFTNAVADAFQLSTDYNYRKLFLEQTLTVAPSNSYTITHGLGYIPQVDLWVHDHIIAKTFPYDYYNSNAPYAYTVSDCQIIITSTTLKVVTGSSTNIDTVYARIYADKDQ